MQPTALLALLLSFAAAAQSQATSVTMLVYPNAGLYEVGDNSRVSGPGAVMLTRLETVSGVQLNRQVMPIARSLKTLALKPGTCVVAMPRTPDRESQYHWAGPWAVSAFSLYGRANETRQVNGPEDMRGAQIAVLRDSIPAAWLKEHGMTGYEVNDAITGLRILHAGRVDFWLGSDLTARLVIKASSGPVPRVLYTFGRMELHVACHPGTSAVTVERLHAGIEQLRRNGELTEFGVR